jgi:hypothetical protein
MSDNADDAPVAAIITWDPRSIAEARAAELRLGNADLDAAGAQVRAAGDTEHFAAKWDILVGRLREILADISPEGRYVALRPDASGTGEAFVARNVTDFLLQLLPDVDSTFTMQRKGDTIFLSASREGAPTVVWLVTRDESLLGRRTGAN